MELRHLPPDSDQGDDARRIPASRRSRNGVPRRRRYRGREPAARSLAPTAAPSPSLRPRLSQGVSLSHLVRTGRVGVLAPAIAVRRSLGTRWEHVARGALVVPLRSKGKRSAPEIGRFVFPQLRQCPPALSQCRANAEAGGRTWPPLRARSSRHSRSRPPKVPAFAAFRSSASVNVIGSRTLSLFSS